MRYCKMYLRIIIMCLTLVAVNVSAVVAHAYSAKAESSDEEYVKTRAAEAAASAEAEADSKGSAPSVPQEHASENGGDEVQEKEEAGSGAEAPSAETVCVVPDIRGDSVSRARSVLRKRHCELGRVTRSRVSEHGVLVVVRQEFRSGAKRPTGTRVRVTIGVAARRPT
jgi:hypothetical protein